MSKSNSEKFCTAVRNLAIEHGINYFFVVSDSASAHSCEEPPKVYDKSRMTAVQHAVVQHEIWEQANGIVLTNPPRYQLQMDWRTGVSPLIVRGIEANVPLYEHISHRVIPLYNKFDPGHDGVHVIQVINKSLRIVESLFWPDFDINIFMVFVAAAYHDLGLATGGRDGHEKRSAEMLRNDHLLRKWFSIEEIRIMCEAVEDHRASSKSKPRSSYGEILADGDRTICYENYLWRVCNYHINQKPHATDEEIFQDAIAHLREKYGHGGYLKLHLNFGQDVQELNKIADRLALSDDELRPDFKRVINKVWNDFINKESRA